MTSRPRTILALSGVARTVNGLAIPLALLLTARRKRSCIARDERSTTLSGTAMVRLPLSPPSSFLKSSRPAHNHVRAFHASLSRKHLVGPPDPVSHLRPVIYDDAPPARNAANVRHPYSLREFTGDTREYQWKMQRQELDAFNQAFWLDVSTPILASYEELQVLLRFLLAGNHLRFSCSGSSIRCT